MIQLIFLMWKETMGLLNTGLPFLQGKSKVLHYPPTFRDVARELHIYTHTQLRLCTYVICNHNYLYVWIRISMYIHRHICCCCSYHTWSGGLPFTEDFGYRSTVTNNSENLRSLILYDICFSFCFISRTGVGGLFQ